MHQPLPPADLEHKFRLLADGRADTDAVISTVRGLAAADGLDDLQEALA